MSKAMVATLPIVMLLLDYWPLNRVSSRGKGETRPINSGPRPSAPGSRLLWQLVLEKLPFLAMSAVAGVLTMIAEQSVGALPSVGEYPIGVRMANALLSSVRYLEQMVWPANLAVFYPFSTTFAAGAVIGAILFWLAMIVITIWLARQCRHWGMGWLWYVVTLLPVSGLIQVGQHSRADRYTYLPLVGVFIALVWGISELIARWRLPRAVVGACAGVLLGACTVGTVEQLRYWQDSETLIRHAIAATKDNYFSHYNLGCYLDSQGRTSEAIESYRNALRINPNINDASINLGVALTRRQEYTNAIACFEAVLRFKADDVDAHRNLGNVFFKLGRVDDAIEQFQIVLQYTPDDIFVRRELGILLGARGRLDEAIVQFREALRCKPEDVLAHNSLGTALAMQRKFDEAIGEYTQALRIEPQNAESHFKLGCLLALSGRRDEAVLCLEEALRLKPDYPEAKKQLRELGVSAGE